MLFCVQLFAAKPDTLKRIYVTRQINPHAPQIDGVLNDPAWESVEWGSDFTQREPNDGAEPSQETAFKILFDVCFLLETWLP